MGGNKYSVGCGGRVAAGVMVGVVFRIVHWFFFFCFLFFIFSEDLEGVCYQVLFVIAGHILAERRELLISQNSH